MTDDLESRIERIEDELGITPEEDEGLPEVNGFQMVEQVEIPYSHDVYVDEDGDVWILDEDDHPVDMGTASGTPGFRYLNASHVQRIAEVAGEVQR